MIKSIINPNALFSFRVAHGSVAKRTELTEQLVEKIYNGIKDYNKESKLEYITKDKFESIIHSKLPENKNIIVRKMNKKDGEMYEAFSGYDFDEYDNVNGHIIELSFKHKHFPLHDTFIFVHEMMHVLDKMLNPKIITRMVNLNNRLYNFPKIGSLTDKYNNVYNSLYGDTYEKFSTEAEKNEILAKHKEKIKRLIAKQPIKEKIDILQNMRYQLWLELHAFTIENKYIEIMGKTKNVDTSELKTKVELYMFEEKIKMIKEIAFKLIKKERIKHKNSLNINSSVH